MISHEANSGVETYIHSTLGLAREGGEGREGALGGCLAARDRRRSSGMGRGQKVVWGGVCPTCTTS